MSLPDDRRLIEDYLPIEAISAEASREKSVRNDVALDMAEEAGFDVSLLRLLLRLHREGTSVVRYAKSPIEFTGCCAEVSGYIDGQNTWTIQATFRDCEHIDA